MGTTEHPERPELDQHGDVPDGQPHLLIISGSARGQRFPLSPQPRTLGRGVGCGFRIDDGEVSRRHAEFFMDGEYARLRDLGSANGTFLHGKPVHDTRIENGDLVRVGATLLTVQNLGSKQQVIQPPIRLLEQAPSSASAILKEINPADLQSASDIPTAAAFELLCQVAEDLVRPAIDRTQRLQRIIELICRHVPADRGCALLTEPGGDQLQPIAAWDRERGVRPDSMAVSTTVTRHVLKTGQGVRTSDAAGDQRFEAAHSIFRQGIGEVICVPLRGQGDIRGVIYLDTTSPAAETPSTLLQNPIANRLNDEHLRAATAAARQTALALESSELHEAMLKAERFAAMGQTIAVLSHHIKNILQGLKGGGYLIETGLNSGDESVAREGWNVVRRNQGRIYDLVMDMLSFSRERAPELQPGHLRELVSELTDLGTSLAEDHHVRFVSEVSDRVPEAWFDREGIHRAVLNLITNAVDAAAANENGAVVLQCDYDAAQDAMVVAVSDNGDGIPEDQQERLFRIFESEKGHRGTGIGLAVSRKIIREHGGRIEVESTPGVGSRFILMWPRELHENQGSSQTMADS